MYSILHIVKDGYKLRFASNDIHDIHDKYRLLISTVKLHPDKLLIYDNQNNKYIQFTNIILPNSD